MNSSGLVSIVCTCSSYSLCVDAFSTAFLASLLKDIKSERPKITEKDHLRLLFVTKWFLEFFLSGWAEGSNAGWGFEMVAEVVDRGWIVWVLRRMRGAVEEKVADSRRHSRIDVSDANAAQTMDRTAGWDRVSDPITPSHR